MLPHHADGHSRARPFLALPFRARAFRSFPLSCAIIALAAVAAFAGDVPAQQGQRTFDHADFDTLLNAHVRDGLVDYDSFAAAPGFHRYLDRLAAFDPSALSRAEQLAFWINAYNAYTIALILAHDERESIRNINRTLGLSLKGPWRERLVHVGGNHYSLDDVEHEIIRPRFGEPRIHFAVVCAAIGCPPLRSEAYRGDVLDVQLDDQARRFLLSTPASNRVDAAARTVALSPIFNWYKEDFGGGKEAIGRFVARLFPAGAERSLLESGRFTLTFTEYDWRLNAQSRRRP
jgi:hypothetical protein